MNSNNNDDRILPCVAGEKILRSYHHGVPFSPCCFISAYNQSHSMSPILYKTLIFNFSPSTPQEVVRSSYGVAACCFVACLAARVMRDSPMMKVVASYTNRSYCDNHIYNLLSLINVHYD